MFGTNPLSPWLINASHRTRPLKTHLIILDAVPTSDCQPSPAAKMLQSRHSSNIVGFSLCQTVKVSYSSEPGVDLTFIKQTGEADGDAGDQYIGLDRFGRVCDQRWIKTSTGTALERIQYGFDQTNNRTFRNNLVAGTLQDEFYSYDNLNQLLTLQRGTLNAGRTGISGTPTREEDFTFDPTGNWHGTSTGYLTKTSGTTDLDQNRSHNKANEITGITTNSGPAWAAPVQDLVGNLTTIPQPLSLT